MINFRIHSLFADYVGPFEHLALEFREKKNPDEAEVHIFTGENGTGKSTLLYLLTAYPNYDLLRQRIHSSHLDKFRVESRYQYLKEINNQPGQAFEFVIGTIRDGNFSFQGLNKGLKITEYLNSFPNFAFHKYQFALFGYSGYRRIDNIQLGAIQELQNAPFDNALNFNTSVNPQLLLQWIANTKTKEALALAKGNSTRVLRYQNAIKKIELALSKITDEKIEFELAEDPLRVLVKVDGVNLDFGLLPDGLKSIISWIADLLMRMDRVIWEDDLDIFDRNFILFLDEIEVHLHPKWQRKILPAIKKLFKNAQIFISTHSPFVVGSVDGAWIYKFKKDGTFSKLDGEAILSEDGKSYRMILDEIFGIEKQFGVEIEIELDRFYHLKDLILKGESSPDSPEFKRLISLLSTQSLELENIIGMELRQIDKFKGSQTAKVL